MSKNVIFSMLALALMAATVLVPDLAFAAATKFGNAICALVGLINGTTGKAIATIAVIFLGISAFFGKVNWGLAVMVAVGIVAIFAAGSLVDVVANAGGAGTGGCTATP